jgi:hypothetical protein
VLGVGDDIDETPRAGVEVIQDSDSLRLTVINAGNLDSAQIVGPQGGKSMRFKDTFGVGSRIIIYDDGFNNSDINVSQPPSSLSLGGQDDLVKGDSDSPGGEECLIRHSADVVRGVTVNGSDIGCSGEVLETAAQNAGNPDADFAGSEIKYQKDANYQFIGIKGSSSSVIRRIRSGDF